MDAVLDAPTAAGRPPDPETPEDERDDRTALLAEMRGAAAMIPLARFVQQYVAADGVGLVLNAQTNVVAYLERLQRRASDR